MAKQMDYILELAQTLNFNRAAENLFISQPTMTYQVGAAEMVRFVNISALLSSSPSSLIFSREQSR